MTLAHIIAISLAVLVGVMMIKFAVDFSGMIENLENQLNSGK